MSCRRPELDGSNWGISPVEQNRWGGRQGAQAAREEGKSRPIFTLKIQGRPGDDNIRYLRLLLKTLLRRHHFKCVDLREDGDQQ
jgi:hypothetical protein